MELRERPSLDMPRDPRATASGPEQPRLGTEPVDEPAKHADADKDARRALARDAAQGARGDPVKRFERIVTTVLIAMMALVIALAVVDLAWVLISDVLSPPFALLHVRELLDVFGLFLLVLIGIELLDTLVAYARERVIRAQVVLLVAMIALVRKIITLEVTEVSSSSLFGIAAIVVAIAASYYLLRTSHIRREARPPEGS